MKTASVIGTQSLLCTLLFGSGMPFQPVSRIQDRNIKQGQDIQFFSPTALTMSEGHDDDDRNPPFLISAVIVTAILASWPLLSFFRDTNNPTDGFDIDMFMALKGMLDNTNSVGTMAIDDVQSIVEIPVLSPAEQLVGAIFGPPR